MKQCIFTLLLFAACQPILHAQWTISPEAGVNFTNVASPDVDAPTEMDTRFFAGVNGQYWISEKMAAGLGVQYSAKGYDVSADPSLLNTFPVRYNYLDFLPGFEYRPWSFLGVFAGVNVGVLLSEQFYTNGSWEEAFYDDFVNDVDFGGYIGARVFVKNVYLKAHFNRSFAPIYEVTYTDENGQEIENAQFFNQNIQVGLGYLIPLKKKG